MARDIALRVSCGIAIVAGYFVAIRPFRQFLMQEVAFPLVSWMAPSGVDVSRASDPLNIELSSGGWPLSLRAPAGIWFLLPALILIVCYPRRSYWIWAFVAFLVLGMIEWPTAVLAFAHDYNWRYLLRFLQVYAVPSVSIGISAITVMGFYEERFKGGNDGRGMTTGD